MVEDIVLLDLGNETVEFEPAMAAAVVAALAAVVAVVAGAEFRVVAFVVLDELAVEEAELTAPATIENWFDCARICSLLVGTIRLI